MTRYVSRRDSRSKCQGSYSDCQVAVATVRVPQCCFQSSFPNETVAISVKTGFPHYPTDFDYSNDPNEFHKLMTLIALIIH
jgi:hypothetical protein